MVGIHVGLGGISGDNEAENNSRKIPYEAQGLEPH